MRDTPDRQLQLDFQRRAPEPAPIAPTSRSERAPRFHDARLTSATRTGPEDRRFLPIRATAPAASDAPDPLPRRRVNDTRLKCEIGTPSSRSIAASPPLADTTRRLARPTAPSAATDDVPERTRHYSPTPAIDAKPEHTGERSLPGALPLFTGRALRLAAPRLVRNRTDRSGPEPAPCKARKPTLLLNWTSQSPAPAPTHWRVTGVSEASLGPPGARRANERAFGNEPGCLSLCGIRPFLFDPEWPRSAGLRPRCSRLFFARERRRSLTDQQLLHKRQAAETTRQQRVAQSVCSARTTSA